MQISGPTGPTGPMNIGPTGNEPRREAAQLANRINEIITLVSRYLISDPGMAQHYLNQLGPLMDQMNSLLESQEGSFTREEMSNFQTANTVAREMIRDGVRGITPEQMNAFMEHMKEFTESVNRPRPR